MVAKEFNRMTHHPKIIIFDIETGPLPEPELLAMMPAFDPADVKCGNLKDPQKVAEKIAEAQATHQRDFVDKAALDALTGRVLAIGVVTIEHTSERLANGGGSFSVIAGDEAGMIQQFWQRLEHEMGRLHFMIGFNICKFDLPFLIRRSWKHGIGYPRGLRKGRYWSDQVCDLRDEWGCGDKMAKGSLDTISKHFGLTGKAGNGADFAKLWETDKDKAIAYLHNDLLLTSALAVKMGVL